MTSLIVGLQCAPPHQAYLLRSKSSSISTFLLARIIGVSHLMWSRRPVLEIRWPAFYTQPHWMVFFTLWDLNVFTQKNEILDDLSVIPSLIFHTCYSFYLECFSFTLHGVDSPYSSGLSTNAKSSRGLSLLLWLGPKSFHGLPLHFTTDFILVIYFSICFFFPLGLKHN
jgi:hypothetical protein